MIEHFVNSWTSILDSCAIVVRRQGVLVVLAEHVILILIVVGDLLSPPRRESHFSLGGECTACGNRLLAQFLFLGRDVSTSTNIAIRAGV